MRAHRHSRGNESSPRRASISLRFATATARAARVSSIVDGGAPPNALANSRIRASAMIFGVSRDGALRAAIASVAARISPKYSHRFTSRASRDGISEGLIPPFTRANASALWSICSSKRVKRSRSRSINCSTDIGLIVGVALGNSAGTALINSRSCRRPSFMRVSSRARSSSSDARRPLAAAISRA
ncbi:MAG: hypothetical protein M0R66_00390 [Candidatus Omnitrophica bacterium]|nr:hypothetical protein [Candidatus Omnitrophota bacterium]